eukprot:Lithocolla_globosa_v1_NODE_7915_length_887_cov_40.563702.p1 type:complete len:216 gc:universal NODE_7915_length_887_cov_40.563702:678-31(-)
MASSKTDNIEEFTVVVIGGGGVGKSCLTVRFLKNDFTSEYDPTVEENYRKKVVFSDYQCMLDLVDTAGQQEYSTLRDQHLRTGQGFLVVYAINDESSFDEAQELVENVTTVKDIDFDKIPFVVCANKCDLPESDRKITVTQGQEFAESIGAVFFETSALANTNVEPSFHALVKECRNKLSHPENGKTPKKKSTKSKLSLRRLSLSLRGKKNKEEQ